MPVQSFWTLGTGSGGRVLSQEVFIVIFAAIVIGWIIVALWTRVIDNFSYRRLGMDKNSTWDSFLIAVGVSIFFVAFVWVIDTYGVIEGTLERAFVSEDDPFFGRAQQQAEEDLFSTSFSGPRNASVATLFPNVVFN